MLRLQGNGALGRLELSAWIDRRAFSAIAWCAKHWGCVSHHDGISSVRWYIFIPGSLNGIHTVIHCWEACLRGDGAFKSLSSGLRPKIHLGGSLITPANSTVISLGAF